MRFVLMADTHDNRPRVPDGDVLIHAGDLTMEGKYIEIVRAAEWLASLPHPIKIVVAGNHDWLFEKDPAAAALALGPNFIYLQDRAAIIDELRLWGAPWQPRFNDWAFNLDRGEPLRRVWAKIPEDVDILVTHGPPMYILDGVPEMVENHITGGKRRVVRHVGCADLLERVKVVRPRLHVFGHAHQGYGVHREGETLFVNCAVGYHKEHAPVIVDYENGHFTLGPECPIFIGGASSKGEETGFSPRE